MWQSMHRYWDFIGIYPYLAEVHQMAASTLNIHTSLLLPSWSIILIWRSQTELCDIFGAFVSKWTCSIPVPSQAFAQFERTHHLSRNNGQRCTKNFSCVGYCGRSAETSGLYVCGCDQSCLYLGDCCFDYLYHCRNHSDLNYALRVQASYRKKFKNKSFCTAIDVLISKGKEVFEYDHRMIPMVQRCPRNADPEISEKCVQNNIFLVVPHIIIHSRGVIYANINCAICNGARTGDMKTIERDVIRLPNLFTEERENIRYVNHLPTEYKSLQQRYLVLCSDEHCVVDEDECLGDFYQEECMAYRATYRAAGLTGHIRPYRNEACFQCANSDITDSSPLCITDIWCDGGYGDVFSPTTLRRWTTLFESTGSKWGHFDEEHTGNPLSCSEPICQSGYVLINDSCLQCIEKTSDNPTFIKAESCMLLLVFRSDKSFEKFKRHFNNLDILPIVNCSKLLHELGNIKRLHGSYHRDMESHIKKGPCTLVTLPYLGVRDYIDALSSAEKVRGIIPGIPFAFCAAFFLNFDPNFGVTCPKGEIVSTEIRTVQLRNGLEVLMQDVEQFPFDNDHTPVVLEMPITKPHEAMKLWKITCLENQLEINCTPLASDSIKGCPKIKVPFIMNSENSSISINSYALSPSEYLVIGNTTILICQERCEMVQSKTRLKALAIVTPVCYSIATLGLLLAILTTWETHLCDHPGTGADGFDNSLAVFTDGLPYILRWHRWVSIISSSPTLY